VQSLDPLATKLAVQSLDPLAFGVARTGLAVPFALLAIRWFGLALPRDARTIGLVTLAGLTGFVLFPILFALGVRETTATRGNLLFFFVPVATGAVHHLLARRWPRAPWWLGAALAGVGLVGLSLARGAGEGQAALRGDLLIVLSYAAAAISYVAGAKAAEAIGTAASTAWAILVSALLTLPFWGDTAAALAAPPVTATALAALAYSVLASTVLGYGLWYWALAAGGIGRIGPLQFLQPVLGALLSVAVLGETLTLAMIVASLLTLAGALLCRRAAS
jgi:drug/metabolite transporter (DMT)-like permease